MMLGPRLGALALGAAVLGASASPLQRRQSLSNSTGATNVTLWDWTGPQKMHGIAVGNWLLLEKWMDRRWFEESCGNASAIDEWTWSQSAGNRAQELLTEHWNTWITDDDVRIMAEAGFNHIRVPFGYWAFFDGVQNTPYVTKGGQIEQLSRIIESAAKYGVYVVLDLHGLPGSQNGEQPSGRVGYNNFYQPQNIAYGEQTVDAIIEYIVNSPHRNSISAFAPMNEPIYYTEDQYRALLGYYESTYAKLSALNPPLPMMFAPGKPETSPFALWQGFINGKQPSLLIYEDHPYVGRLAPLQSQDSYISQVCQKARQYANYAVPVAVTEWSVSTAIEDNRQWNSRFFAAQARAWAQSAGGIFWSYRVNAYPDLYEQTENYTLYSFIDLYNGQQLPLPEANETTTEYIYGFRDECNFGTGTDTYSSVVPSVQPTVTNAFTRRSLAEPTQGPGK